MVDLLDVFYFLLSCRTILIQVEIVYYCNSLRPCADMPWHQADHHISLRSQDDGRRVNSLFRFLILEDAEDGEGWIVKGATVWELNGSNSDQVEVDINWHLTSFLLILK